jgi:hypothetical protein
MALIKTKSRGINLTDNFAFTGTVSGAGKIVQVKQTVVATFPTNNSANAWTNIGDVTITPTNANNDILIQVVVAYGGTDNNYSAGRVLRTRTTPAGSDNLRIGNANFTETRFTDASFGLQMNASANDTYKVWNTTFNYLDTTHNSTSSTTYSVQGKSDGGYASRTLFINRSESNPGDGHNPPPWTTITVTEIAA